MGANAVLYVAAMTARLVVVTTLFWGLGCAQASAPSEARASPLVEAFDDASAEYQVPRGLLLAMAHVQTRVDMVKTPWGGVGLLQLVSRADWNTVEQAARLTGRSADVVSTDEVAHVRGAAAVLRALFDKTQLTQPSLSPHELGDWYPAVSLFPGYDGAVEAQGFAADVFRTLETGFELTRADGRLALAPTASRWRVHAPDVEAKKQALGDYPGIARYDQSPNYSSGHGAYDYVVIHTMEGYYNGSISWFNNTSSRVSAHYLIRSSDGEITQMVAHADTAWHAGCYNSRSIGIEHEGFMANPSQWYTTAMYTESAKLTRWIATRHNIPLDRSHVIGHVEVGGGCNSNGHTDPGTGWNWTRYMDLVLNQTPSPSTGVFIGAIYTGGNTSTRVSGATVTITGQSIPPVTTGTNGIYQFTLPPGTYTATVTKPGYGSNTVTRAVVANTQAWGSMEINPTTTQPGTLSGVVHVYNASNPSDLSQRVAQATVSANGQTVTTDAQGNFSFSLPAGTYTVQVTKAGYVDAQASRSVSSGQTTTVNVGLTAMSMPDVQPPQLVIASPTGGASVDLAVVRLSGTASDDRGAISTVRVSVNAGPDSDVTVVGGSFSTDVRLRPGSNVLLVRARDGANNEGSATVTVTFRAGIDGVVFESGTSMTPVPGARVDLRLVGGATTLATATADSSGAFSVDVPQVGVDAVLTIEASGFITSHETVTLNPDGRSTLRLPLTRGSMMQVMPTLTFAEPMDGATVDAAQVTVFGQVTGLVPATITVNGVAASFLAAGGFSATGPRAEGLNTLRAVATAPSSATVAGTLTVTRPVASQPVQPGPTAMGLTPAQGGCGCSAGSALVPLLGLLGGSGRRRRRG